MSKKQITNKPAQYTLKVVNQVDLDPLNPIPITYGGNSFSYSPARNRKYISFLGDDNFPSLLLEARLTSPTQDACVSSIAASALGNGIVVTNAEKPDAELFEWMKSVNEEMESFDDIMLGAFDGERGLGTQFIEVVKGEFNNTPFMKLHLHSLLDCRFGEPDDRTAKPVDVIITKQFAKRGHLGNKRVDEARRVPLWSPNPLDSDDCWTRNNDGSFSTMLVFKNKRSGVDHYGLPASIGSLRQQVLEARNAQYNLDNLDNNMILGGMLMFKSAMTQDEAEKNAENIILSHTGTGRTGRVAVISSENGLDDVKFEKYETTKDGSFIEADKRIEEKIIASNSWNGVFIGLSRNASLGTGGKYIREAWDVVEASVLNPLRRKAIDKIVVPIMKIYSEVFNTKEVLKYEFWFNSAKPFSFMSSLDASSFVEVNEARDMAGLPQDDSMKGVYLSQMKAKQNVQGKPAAEEGADNS